MTLTTMSGRYIWACSVCRDPNYLRTEGPLYYMDERFCWTCGKMQPIISYHGEHIPTDLRSHEPPRNSGEGTAVNGPMPLAGGDESQTHEHE